MLALEEQHVLNCQLSCEVHPTPQSSPHPSQEWGKEQRQHACSSNWLIELGGLSAHPAATQLPDRRENSWTERRIRSRCVPRFRRETSRKEQDEAYSLQ
jgi:hypothetical protein